MIFDSLVSKINWLRVDNLDVGVSCKTGTPETTQALLDGVADAKAKDKNGKTPWDLAYTNEKLKGTKAYRTLNDAQYN